ncbi:hypothetical protein F5Y15DRAFT_366459 [Xylariaceae sp. FL0016]|nr:hypothetical protein F5Y15DRAFT_366459 [Xylariaceae sp. FL0016]
MDKLPFDSRWAPILNEWKTGSKGDCLPHDRHFSFHCLLRHLLGELEALLHRLVEEEQTATGICNKSVADVNDVLLRLRQVVVKPPECIQAYLEWLAAIFSLRSPFSRPADAILAGIPFPELTAPWPGQGHTLYLEAVVLNSKCDDGQTWASLARSYLNLLTQHQAAFERFACAARGCDKLRLKSMHGILQARVEALAYAPEVKLNGKMASMLSVIESMATEYHEPLMAYLQDTVPGLESMHLTDTDKFPGVISPTTQLAGLRLLGLWSQSDPARAAAPSHILFPPKEMAGALLGGGLKRVSPAPLDPISWALTKRAGLRGPDPLRFRAYLAMDLPGWVPGCLGRILIQRMEETLEERACKILELRSEVETSSDEEEEGDEDRGVEVVFEN